MKHLALLCLVLCCSIFSQAQSINTEIATEGEKPFLLGKIDKNGLTSNNYKSWFFKNHDAYKLDEANIKSITPLIGDFKIKLFMGTWCGDSKREVPRFYKILEASNFPVDQITAIALSRKSNMYKQSPNHEEAGLNIHRVPTFIFYKDGKEVNRIVEEPVETLEKDILNILTINSYKSNYQIVAKVNSILENKGIKGLKKQSKLLVENFKGKTKNMFELNTYGRILYSTNRNNEAIEVFKLNTKLFPDNPRTYISLANTLGVNGKKGKAIKVMKKAIKKFPENEDLKENLTAIKSN
ncbi:thioredoxin family protein [Ichthyenterobacterium magnum]|uniref:Uncharacterized protein n=1 Tax=Ichthyenterobacterium magnum TaxID=1230530 RepID=A0A420DG35_9FLAO|nr:thioredoxin family protein [Ichthyenterobacterium magnum]RKE92011.1 hypothetical protein BXY80_2443 [Ichthyenterobacterium magnum]